MKHVCCCRILGVFKENALGTFRQLGAVRSWENRPYKYPLKSAFENRGFWPLTEPCLTGQIKQPDSSGDSGNGDVELHI